MDQDRLADFRSVFAQIVVARAACRDLRIRDAFAKVARHLFVGPGPWLLSEDGGVTATADPALLYQDVALGLAPERGITTGLPSLHARCIDRCAPMPGEHVIQVGVGMGYFTAIFAELVGDTGTVTGLEIDEPLAMAAREMLRDWPWARVEHRSGIDLPENSADIIYVCASLQQIPRAWIRALRPGGRLACPLTPGTREGGYLLVHATHPGRFSARFICPVRAIPCIGAQDPAAEIALAGAFQTGTTDSVRSLKLAPEEPDDSCWFAGAGFWLSTSP